MLQVFEATPIIRRIALKQVSANAPRNVGRQGGRSDEYTWNENPDKKSGGPFACDSSYHASAVLCRIESAQRVGGSKLCAANGLGVQWLPLHASGTQPGRTEVQAARLR